MTLGSTTLDEAAERQRALVQKLSTFNRTDRGNAEAFALLHGHRFRFDHTRGTWLLWSGRLWMKDETGAADKAAVDTARHRLLASMQIEDPEKRKASVGWAFRSEGSYGRKAMLASAETIEELATTAANYNRDPYALVVGNGHLDLRTAILRECRPEDLITRGTVVPYIPDATCPHWLDFLHQVFGGDEHLVGFVQRAVGYSLSGNTSEKCLFILWGNGANGKSVALEILLALAGDHACVTSFSTFLSQRYPGAPRNDIAGLYGARLVKAAESQHHAELDEAVIKEITGNDTVSARFLFHEAFEFVPEFHIWLATNHRPVIRGTDHAIWRRIRLIPFHQQFSGKKRDPKLREKLEAELPGILSWAVTGFLAWQRIGLGNTPVVEQATAIYRRESDDFAQFIRDRCFQRPSDQTPARELYEGYLDWCSEQSIKPVSNNLFDKGMGAHGVNKKRASKGTFYLGVVLKQINNTAKAEKSDDRNRK